MIDVQGIGTEVGRTTGQPDLVVVLVHAGALRGHGGFDAQRLRVEAGTGVLRAVYPAVDMLVAQFDRIREVRPQRQVLVARVALEALTMEDHLVDGAELLHLVDPLSASLASGVIRYEKILQAARYAGIVVRLLLARSVQPLRLLFVRLRQLRLYFGRHDEIR